MPTIIKIGYNEYLVEKNSQAVAAITALAGAIRLDSRYVKDQRIYWPARGRDHEVGMITIAKGQLLAAEPPPEFELEHDTVTTPPPKKILRLNSPQERSGH